MQCGSKYHAVSTLYRKLVTFYNMPHTMNVLQHTGCCCCCCCCCVFTSLYYCCCNIATSVCTVLCCTLEVHFYISLLPETWAHYKKVHWATSRAYNWCAKTFAPLLAQPLDFWQPTVPSEWTAHLIMFHTLHQWGPFSNVHRSILQ